MATAGHDTAAAVAAVPAEGSHWAYISSGTWSLVGVEEKSPVISPASLAANFTNEGGVRGTIRFLKNVTGLWLVQGCRKAWSKDASISYDDLVREAAAAPAFTAFVDPDSPTVQLVEAGRRFYIKIQDTDLPKRPGGPHAYAVHRHAVQGCFKRVSPARGQPPESHVMRRSQQDDPLRVLRRRPPQRIRRGSCSSKHGRLTESAWYYLCRIKDGGFPLSDEVSEYGYFALENCPISARLMLN